MAQDTESLVGGGGCGKGKPHGKGDFKIDAIKEM